MRYLIDTQIAIWAKENNPRLKTPIRDILEDLDNEIFISQFSLQELVIKQQIGKLPGFIVRVSDFARQLFDDGFLLLPISNDQLFSYQHLPFYDDHRDPFDRFLAATALSENLIFITADEKFERYQPLVQLLLAR
ncbi:type II toxin-antitoxin system VapC family toxin [Spirosoma areae]